jgi:RNA polymerase sigma-70 factor (ECF subfamily)
MSAMPRRHLFIVPPPGPADAVGGGPALGLRPGAAPEPETAEAADLAVVQRVLDGDTEAFAAVVHRHGARLVALCSRLTGSAAVGEELAQEALARAYAGLGAYREDGPFRLWLLRIAVNACRDWLKAGARRERPVGDEAEAEGARQAATRAAPAPDPQRVVAGRLALAALADAVAALPPAYREAFTLFHVEGLAYQEMRAVTGVRVNALKVRVHRARERLRRALGDWLDDDGRTP